MHALFVSLLMSQAPADGIALTSKTLMLDGALVTAIGTPTEDEFFTVPALEKALVARKRDRQLPVRIASDVPFGVVRRVLTTLVATPNPKLVVQDGDGGVVWAWADATAGAPLELFIGSQSVRVRLAGEEQPEFSRGKAPRSLIESSRTKRGGVVLVPDALDTLRFGEVLAELKPFVDVGVKLQLSRVPPQQGPHFGPKQQFKMMIGLLAPVTMDGGTPSGGFGSGPIGSSRSPRVSTAPGVLGSLSKEELKAGLQPQLRAIRGCYDQALRSDGPSSGGVLKIFFVVGVTGDVTEAGVESVGAGLSTTLQECVLDAVKRVKTVPPRGGVVRVVYPFRFSPGE
ncbi:MAG: AgmX/PglI C-terminal domain-containing protein [Myxococcales bacterium]|nr:AgmX/PglI C-terminal domain-containing protein [Myxococcales bacterium]